MKCVTCINNIVDNTVDIFPVGQRPEMDDPRYLDEDVHVIPCPTGEFIVGAHEFSRECACHVKLETQYQRVLVIHNHRVN